MFANRSAGDHFAYYAKNNLKTTAMCCIYDIWKPDRREYEGMNLRRRSATPATATQTAKATWKLAYLDIAAKEGRKFLDDARYAHAVSLCEQLATEESPTMPHAIDVRAVEDFHELRDKGGVLGKINLRIFFVIRDRTIVVLGCFKKENEGQTPTYVKIRMRNRIRFLDDVLSREG